MRQPARTLYLLTTGAIIALGVWGLLLSLFPLQPFWIDEWRLIYNLKFRPVSTFWQPLSYTQQFPRLYLVALKVVTEAFHYSYTVLRLPALCVSVTTMLLAWRLMRRIFPQREDALQPLFVLIIISSQTFTSYLVQTKHYEMEIFLAVLALWQAMELNRLHSHPKMGWRYAALCCSMGIAPFFSYTYPIAAAPLYLLSVVPAIRLARERRRMLQILLPLLIGLCGILAFYITDVRQLMRDEAMHRYWAYRMACGNPLTHIQNVWFFFATVGAGVVFEIIFGILGIAALAVALRNRFTTSAPHTDPAVAYASTLLSVVLAIFFLGRLPLGEAKFSAFCVPAQAVLIVKLLQWTRTRIPRIATMVAGILYAGLLGNIVLVIYQTHHAPEYSRRMAIYRNTEAAIDTAQRHNAAILITPGVAWPDEIVHKVPFLQNMPADAILKTFPAYSASQLLPVYAIADTAEATAVRSQRAVVGDGINYRVTGAGNASCLLPRK